MSESRKKILFIINPISGHGKALQYIPIIKKQFEGTDFDITIKESNDSGHSSEIAEKAVAEAYTAVVAVGGDGTVNEIGKVLVGKNVALGILPTGSGNGLARHLGIPMDIPKSIERIKEFQTIKIDTAILNGRRFLNAAGIGFDAQVSWEFAGLERRGLLNYVKIIVKLISKMTEFNADLSWNNQTKNTKAVMISFANSAQFGNNAKIAPTANIQDGKIDICILKKLNPFQMFLFAFDVMTGRLKESSYFSTFKTDKIQLKTDNELAHLDGEPIKIAKEISIVVDPLSLLIIT